MKSFKARIYTPTPNPRPGGGYKLLAALVGYWCPTLGLGYWCPTLGLGYWCPTLGLGYGALRNCISRQFIEAL
jgi:hypothetical protein